MTSTAGDEAMTSPGMTRINALQSLIERAQTALQSFKSARANQGEDADSKANASSSAVELMTALIHLRGGLEPATDALNRHGRHSEQSLLSLDDYVSSDPDESLDRLERKLKECSQLMEQIGSRLEAASAAAPVPASSANADAEAPAAEAQSLTRDFQHLADGLHACDLHVRISPLIIQSIAHGEDPLKSIPDSLHDKGMGSTLDYHIDKALESRGFSVPEEESESPSSSELSEESEGAVDDESDSWPGSADEE